MDYLEIDRKSIIPNLFLFGTLFIYTILMLNNPVSLSFSIYLSFLANLLIVLIGILSSTLPISLNKISMYFILIFLVVVPFYQLTTGYEPRSMYLTNEEILFTNLLIFIWCAGYLISYHFDVTNTKVSVAKQLTIPRSPMFYLFLLIVSLVSFVLAIAMIGFSNLFVRDAAQLDEGTFSIMIDLLLRTIPVISLSIFLWTAKKKISIGHPIFLYTGIVTLSAATFILNYPVSLSRFLVGAVYLGLLMSGMDFSIFKGKRFDLFLIFTIIVVFPLMYLFKFYTLDQILSSPELTSSNNYNSVDFDAFQMIGRTIRYIRDVGLQMGGQLRSVIFFFVPQDIFDLKGIPSGELVAEYQNVSFTNLSSPIVAEGLIDFGVIGVIAYSFIVGKITKYFDFSVYRSGEDKKDVYFNEITFSFLLGFVVYIYRGALQPSFLRLMGFLLFLMVLYFFVKVFSYFTASKRYMS